MGSRMRGYGNTGPDTPYIPPDKPLSDTEADLHVEESGPLPGERPLLAALPPGTPWWARLLHWFGVRAVGQR